MEMLHFDFMRRAFYAGGLIALLASVLGVYLMLRKQALMADTLSHVSLAGVAAGAILKINPTLSGFAIAVVGAVAVESIRRFYPSYSEMSIAIIMTGGLATAVVLMSLNPSVNQGFSAYLFGSVVAVNPQQLWLMLIVTVIGGLYFWLLRRPLYQITFDEETAKANGLPVRWLSFSFSILTGMTVAAAMPIVGVLLVSALIVLPAALAIRLAAGFTSAILLAMIFGLTGVYTGLTFSYQLGTPPGGTIALLLLFLLSGIGLKRVWLRIRMHRNRKLVDSGQGLPVGASRTPQ
ncbi:metal ABC transporter permease [Paenibacillus sp. J2TS4]|uniref:metal ABC transporter permease n=1 Tax=Paenibacillus sp. J2TS4 TaxID=2807194 RepID=UPI001B194C51|nr:metal ABC transporter permease [Paenibacillus sp. J2TS4]GIP33183.1 high-affinity zinc uptake system membrane protein ZnuB [Paenibacillus sp. J2TS4]